ncbi:alpha-L-fucosidase [Conyzicola lurida]|uniref:alpha-L-fucosidase n=1 Tax=Conyzicola lurida TaxID=1172621 RepID=A0A841ASM7_9MICO|nr:alpha-L-fucosidase [Conyzicola lurida]MBB5844801.1 alpha-L-fucosidase [Conyzicola lurida]
MTAQSRLPEWARDASFGIFVHWGPYSVPAWAEPTGAWGAVPPEEWFAHNAYAEWYANTVRIAGSPAEAHQREEHGGAPYDSFLDRWKAEEYSPSDWAALFAAAGADYVIPVTKHHDGVTLWDAPGSGDLTTVARGPKRDLLAPLADAVRAEGIRFGVYYSGGLDWAFTDFPPLETMEHVDDYRPVDDAYARYATGHVRDLIDRYRPSVIWNDIEWPDAGKADGTLDALMAHYRAVVPDGIVNDRWGTDLWDYRTSEYSHDTQNEAGVGWEHNRGLGFSFGFNQLEDESLTLGPRELARLYADIVSRGGRLLLNIGPKASGEIPAVQRRTLEGISAWMGEVKPLTIGRSPVAADAVTASSPSGEAPWFRAWRVGDRIVVVVDSADTVVTATGEVVRVQLPE